MLFNFKQINKKVCDTKYSKWTSLMRILKFTTTKSLITSPFVNLHMLLSEKDTRKRKISTLIFLKMWKNIKKIISIFNAVWLLLSCFVKNLLTFSDLLHCTINKTIKQATGANGWISLQNSVIMLTYKKNPTFSNWILNNS